MKTRLITSSLALLASVLFAHAQFIPANSLTVDVTQIDWADGTTQRSANITLNQLSFGVSNSLIYINSNGTATAFSFPAATNNNQALVIDTNGFISWTTNVGGGGGGPVTGFVSQSGDFMLGDLDLQSNSLLEAGSIVFSDTNFPGEVRFIDMNGGYITNVSRLTLTNGLSIPDNFVSTPLNQTWVFPLDLSNVRGSSPDNITLLRGTDLDTTTATNSLIFEAFASNSTNAYQTAYAFDSIFVPPGLDAITNIVMGFKHGQEDALGTNDTYFTVRFASGGLTESFTMTNRPEVVLGASPYLTKTNLDTTGTFLANNLIGQRLEIRIEAKLLSTNPLNTVLGGVWKDITFQE